MDWIENYDFFLFDFDGLLVNTEEIHYLSYKKMCEERGVDFLWNFDEYCTMAHYKSEALKNKIYESIPDLQGEEWSTLYNEKTNHLIDLYNKGRVELMPGVESLLNALYHANIRRCVVTNSSQELVDLICEQQKVLQTIPHWVTREDYQKPKPDPECYQAAIERLGHSNDRIIGFEDSPRGLNALMGTRAKPVIVTRINYPEIPDFINKGVLHFNSFDEVLNIDEEEPLRGSGSA